MKKQKNSLVILIFIAIIILLGIIYGTYALWSYKSKTNARVNTITHGLDYYINYTKGQDITSSTLNPSKDYTGGNSATIELWKKDDTYNIIGTIYLDIKKIGDKLKNEEALRWTLVTDESIIREGNFKDHNAQTGSSFIINRDVPLRTTKQTFTVYIWLDENIELTNDPTGEELTISVRVEANNIRDTGMAPEM